MSVIQAKGFCWEVISYFFSGILPCADPSTKASGIMRGLEGLLFFAAWSTSLEDQNISPNISFYEKDMGQKLLIRSPLFIDTLQVLWGLCAFIWLFFLLQRSCICSRHLGRVWGGCMQWCECCRDHSQRKFNFAGVWLQWPSWIGVPLPGTRLPSADVSLHGDAPTPHQRSHMWAEREVQSHCRLGVY